MTEEMCSPGSQAAGISRRPCMQLELAPPSSGDQLSCTRTKCRSENCDGPPHQTADYSCEGSTWRSIRLRHVAADWPDLDDEGRRLVFQRLKLYAIVASFGWPTAIASSTDVSVAPANLLLPPGTDRDSGDTEQPAAGSTSTDSGSCSSPEQRKRR